MNLKEYIASGVVEMYALGSLSDTERTEFEQKLLMYPELSRELKQVQVVLEDFAALQSVNPSPVHRQQVITAVAGESAGRRKTSPENQQKNHSLTYKYLIAASLAALAISTFASWFFFSRWEESEERFSDMLNQKNQLAQNYNILKEGFDKTLYDLLVIRDPHTEIIHLLSPDSSLSYQARLYRNKESEDIYIDVLELPQAPAETHYALWGVVEGRPENAGRFDVYEFSGAQRMNPVKGARGWFVCLETNEMDTVPDLEKIILVSVAGN
jgi:hypothetical protein